MNSKDVTFKLHFEGKGALMRAHKVVLATCKSSYFKTLVKGKFKESTTNIVELQDCNPVVFQIAIKSVYGILTPEEPDEGNSLELTKEYLKNIFDAASLFDCHHLVSRLVDLQCLANKLLLVDLALQYNDEFIKYIRGEFCENFYDMVTYFEENYTEIEQRIELLTKVAKCLYLRPIFINEFLINCQIINDKDYFGAKDLIIELLKKCDIQYLLKDDVGKVVIRQFARLGYVDNCELIKFYQYSSPIILEICPLKVGFQLGYNEFLRLQLISKIKVPTVVHMRYYSREINQKELDIIPTSSKNQVIVTLYEQ